MHEGDEIVTVEGLEALDEGRRSQAPRGAALGEVPALHPLQAAFVEEDAFQCGYCTPGQLCSGVALLAEVAAGEASLATWEAADAAGETAPATPGLDEEEIRERMSGNLCRCGAYPNIVAALRRTGRGDAGSGQAR
jgi:xanthine dehydrogenase YagT iron-sulfur-binding subunit